MRSRLLLAFSLVIPTFSYGMENTKKKSWGVKQYSIGAAVIITALAPFGIYATLILYVKRKLKQSWPFITNVSDPVEQELFAQYFDSNLSKEEQDAARDKIISHRVAQMSLKELWSYTGISL